jgi:hypothetical protein
MTVYGTRPSHEAAGRAAKFLRLIGIPLFALAFFFHLPAYAQFETASILGFVHDSTGAAIPNSKVTLIDIATGVSTSVTTDAQGQYQFTSVRIGQYKIQSEAAGFSAAVTEPFTVEVNARQRVDVSLKPGAVSDTVTVTDAAKLLESETSERGQVISPREVSNLPLNGRAYADLALLAPGVRRNNLENQTVTSRDASYNVNGQRSEFNNFLLDGLDNNAYGTSNQGFSNQAIPPSPDAINEFRVETDNYSAEYGRSSGAVINVSINSGTNHFHGRVWEYNRNTDFNAIGPFAPPVDAATHQAQKPVLVKNQFGGSIGGPIWKDHLFFFADYEGNRQVQGQYAAVTIPNALQRQGIFTTTAGAPVPLHNPITGAVYANGVVPMSDWNALAKLVIADLPAPNIPNAFSNNYVSVPKADLTDDKGDLRIDDYFNARTTFFFRYSDHQGNIVDAASIPGPAGGGSSNGTIHAYNRQIVGGSTYTFNQNSILDARIGFTWTEGGKTPYGFDQPSLLTQAGITGLSTNPAITRSLNVQSVTSFTAFGSQGSSPQFQNPFVINPKLNYSWIHGRNSVKTGYEFQAINTEIDDFNPVYGQDTYGGAFSSGLSAATGGVVSTDTGAKEAAYLTDFLTGARNSYQLNNFVVVNYHQYMNFFYVQDDLKLTPKLTINAGLRYELVTPQYVSGNHLANFDPANNTLVQASYGSLYNRALVHTPKLDFAPRFGVAYQLNDKTVIRSAYGLSFDQFNREGGENLLAYNGPYIVNSSITQTPKDPLCAPDVSSTNCFRPTQEGYSANFVSPSNFSTALAETRYIPKNIATGYVQAWQLGVQRQIGKSTVFDISYVGEHGVKLWVLADLNQAAPNVPSATCSNKVTTGCVPLLNRRPIAGFTGIEESINAGFLLYNGLQTKIEHRYANGVYFLNSFTYSRAIDNASGHLDTPNNDNSRVNLANLKGETGESAYDQPLNDTLTLIYDLPYGHGRMFGSNANRLLQTALGGWQVTAINTATSGQPVNLIYSEPTQFDVSDLLNYRPNVTGNPITPQGQRIKTATAVSNFLNPATVSVPTDVSHPYGNAGRNSLRDYPYYELDTGVHKAFPLWSDASNLDFRAEAFNVLNQVNYAAPDSNRSDGSFGSITSAFPARQLQLALMLIL